jgi:ribose 5-phosphate isomerase B
MQVKLTISMGSDHAGYVLKDLIKTHLQAKGFNITDRGTNGPASVDYPDFAHQVATDITGGQSDLGIVICGSGNGINMTVNKHQGIRSALCWTPELGALARQHNNANVLALPARFITTETALAIVDAYLNAAFEGGRHQNRIDKISCA